MCRLSMFASLSGLDQETRGHVDRGSQPSLLPPLLRSDETDAASSLRAVCLCATHCHGETDSCAHVPPPRTDRSQLCVYATCYGPTAAAGWPL
jgi:hypothetical protein